MKSERRHQLQQNELAGQIDRARNWLEPYLVPILIGVIAVMVVAIAVSLFQNRSVSQRSDATVEMLLSATAQPGVGEDPEILARVSESFGSGAPAMIAALAKSDIYLSRGIDTLYTDRDESATMLEEAVRSYREVLEQTEMPLLRSRAQYGLAQALESQGKLEEAIAAYEDVVVMNESEAMVEVAKKRMEALQRPVVQEFVAWFDKQTPSSFDPANPPQVPSGSGLPDFPDFALPDVTTPGGATGAASPVDIGELLRRAGSPPMDATPTDEATTEAGSEDSAAVQEVPAEEPQTEEPQTEEPQTEEPQTEEPAVEEPAEGEPAAEEPQVEASPGDEPADDQPAEDQPAEDQPAEDQPAEDQPAAEPSADDSETAQP